MWMATHRANWARLGFPLAVAAAVFAVFWLTGDRGSGLAGFVATGLSLAAAAGGVVWWLDRASRRAGS